VPVEIATAEAAPAESVPVEIATAEAAPAEQVPVEVAAGNDLEVETGIDAAPAVAEAAAPSSAAAPERPTPRDDVAAEPVVEAVPEPAAAAAVAEPEIDLTVADGEPETGAAAASDEPSARTEAGGRPVRSRGRWRRRSQPEHDHATERDVLAPAASTNAEHAPAATAAAESAVEAASRPAVEAEPIAASSEASESEPEPIIPEPTWSATEDRWRRLVAEAGFERPVARTQNEVATISQIVPAPSAAATEGRWRRLVVEAAAAAEVDDVAEREIRAAAEREPDAPRAPEVIDLVSEAHSWRVADDDEPAATTPSAAESELTIGIERLPNVGDDMREMIRALRRKPAEHGEHAVKAASERSTPRGGATRPAASRSSRYLRMAEALSQQGDEEETEEHLSDRRRGA